MNGRQIVGGAWLLLALSLGACQAPLPAPAPSSGSTIGATPPSDAEGCEHMAAGPATAATATAVGGSTAPSVSEPHRRFDVTLPEAGGQRKGVVRFQSGKAGDYVVFLNRSVPLAVQAADGTPVAPEKSEASSAACRDIKGRHVVPLAVGTYYLTLGPTDQQTVSLVIEAAAEPHTDDPGKK